jgi:hypothetical protein
VSHAAGRLQQQCDAEFEPHPTLLEQRVERGGGHSIRRVTKNGEVWFRSTFELRLGESAWRARDETPRWQLQATLPRDELVALKEAITASGFFECEPEYRPDRAVFYATDEVWSADLCGRQHTVAVRGRPITDVPALSSVADVLTDALADAAYG